MKIWDETMHPVKRHVSRFEKRTFPVAHRPGKLLVFPGEPDTEIEELLELGADPRDIVAIERDRGAADALYDHYFDQCSVHWVDAGHFLERAETGAYSYVHLDFCGHLGDDEMHCITETARILAPQSRLRVSLLRNRKMNRNLQFEQLIRDAMLIPLVTGLAHADERLGWEEMITQFQESEDTGQLVTALVILSHFYGCDPWSYADTTTTTDTPTVPPVAGRHWIYNVQRWHYHEASGKSAMETIWFDMMQLPDTHLLGPAQLFQLLHSLTIPTPQYAHVIGEEDDDDREDDDSGTGG